MHEKTAEEYLTAVKSVLDSVKVTISEIANEVGANDEKAQQALMHGVKIGASAARPGLTRSVALRNGWGDFDWEEIKKTYLAGPEPSREEKEAALKLLKTTPHLIRRALLRTAKKLSHDPGGHPRALSREQEIAACKSIEAYRIQEHMDTAEAIDRVALELNWKRRTVSPRTLRRRYKEYCHDEVDKSRTPTHEK